ncbi:MAG: hypothetical protein LBB81_09395 [Treponema sp.]|jgi:hypothetical protein|nr:hypothetical protein [Treponema sp.]
MKKVKIILPLILNITVILACTMPSSVDIKWTPDLTIPASSDFNSLLNEYFTKNISGTDEMKILPCDKGNTMTMALYMPIIGANSDEMLKNALTTQANDFINKYNGKSIDSLSDSE